MVRQGALVAAGLLAILASCASVPRVPVPAGSRIVVRLYDADPDVELALANESYPELADLYSRARPDGSLKLAPDRLVGELLASLERAEFGRFAVEGAPDGHGSYLLIDQDGHQRVFREPGPDAPVEERQAFAHMKLVMDHYYQHVGGLQYVRNPEGPGLFREERR